jgi:hypothetical protein
LRIREGDPDGAYFFGAKKTVEIVDVCSKKGNIAQLFFYGCFCATPHPCPFDIYADVVIGRKLPGQANGIFPFATSQLKDQWIGILKMLGIPAGAESIARSDLVETGLKEIRKRGCLRKPLQFPFRQIR